MQVDDFLSVHRLIGGRSNGRSAALVLSSCRSRSVVVCVLTVKLFVESPHASPHGVQTEGQERAQRADTDWQRVSAADWTRKTPNQNIQKLFLGASWVIPNGRRWFWGGSRLGVGIPRCVSGGFLSCWAMVLGVPMLFWGCSGSF